MAQKSPPRSPTGRQVFILGTTFRIPYSISYPWVKQFGRFAVVGLGNALVDFVVYIALTRGLAWWQEHFLLANAVAFLLANINSFIWNRWWTFAARQGSPLRQYGEFLGVSLVYLFFIQLGLWLAVAGLGWYDLWAKVAVIGLGMLLYFIVLRRWVFWGKTRPRPVV
ncbi:MAG: GtrA family protein [Candidatus Veblenbacteria bacterium]|nr:GtrA family protein [Candidatus Veblenbacteria bacterium]